MDKKTITISQRTSSPKMILSLGLISMLSGFLVVFVFHLTLEPIKENKRQLIEKSIFQVVPEGEIRRNFFLTDQALLTEKENDSLPIYAVYNKKGELKGIAAEASAQGYADMIRLLYGYDPYCECIIGISVIKMAETPGLGDKIIKDHNFLQNFKALDSKLNAEGNALANPIVTVKSGTKKFPWEIDAISGATVSSNAVGKALNDSTQILLPKLKRHLEKLKTNQDIRSQEER
jgi:Na+-translocating ferredoxin:NAD+ oxidoreductase subunit G